VDYINRALNPFGPHIFFVSRQTSTSPLTAEIIQSGKHLHSLKLPEDTLVTISADYGNRVLITNNNIAVDNIHPEDITEIVDFDPIKQTMMVIGTSDPNRLTPVHWLIHRARHDIHAVIFLASPQLVDHYTDRLPNTEQEQPPASIDAAKEILKALQQSNTIMVRNQGILAVGINLKTIYQNITTVFKGETHL
jgi:ribulose-5-phosphate 4-epimerase/fuculose-1-phosphate aldolase